MCAHFLPLGVYSFFSKFHQNSIRFECIFGVFAQWKTRFFLSKKVFKNCIFHWFWPLFRNFCKTEKFSQVQNFLRIFTVAPGKYTGDHRQIMGIMGRSWAVSRVFHKFTWYRRWNTDRHVCRRWRWHLNGFAIPWKPGTFQIGPRTARQDHDFWKSPRRNTGTPITAPW